MSLLVQLTDAGAVLMAEATGPIILDSFKIGSDYGYIPDPAQTDIAGTLIYTGVPSNPVIEDGNYTLYAVNLGSALGPFQYGEVGLFQGSTLFAICVFETPQNKLPLDLSADTGGNVVIDIHIPITDPNYTMWADVTSANTFKLNIIDGPHLLSRAQGASPNLMMVKAPSLLRPGFLCYTDRQKVWQYDGYRQVSAIPILSATTSSVTVSQADALAALGEDAIYADGEVVLQLSSGLLIGHTRYCSRKVNASGDSQLNLSVALTSAPLPGDMLNVYLPDPSYLPASDTVAGVVKLKTSSEFPSSSDDSAATPAYVALSSGGGESVLDAFDSDPVDEEKFMKAKRFLADFELDEGLGQVLVKAATEVIAGKIAIATFEEALEGLDEVKAITSASLNEVFTVFASTLVDKYVVGVVGYNNTTHSLIVGLSDSSTVSLSMTGVIADLANSLPQASTVQTGVVRLATNAETTPGLLGTVAATPAGVKASIDAIKDLFDDLVVDPEKVVKGKRFTTDFSFDEGTKQVLMRQASTTAAGKVELATPAETTTGLDATRAATPVGVKAVRDATVKSIQDADFLTLSSVAGINTITAVLTPALTAYKAGQTFRMVVPNDNTGATTVNVDGLGPINVTKNVADPLVGGELIAGAVVQFTHDGTNFQILSGAGGGGGGTGNGAVNNFAQGDLVVAAGTGQMLVGPCSFNSISNAGRLVIL